MAQIKLHDILWETKNGGASPCDNRRTELYFAGCQKALSGNACKNCFNPALWDNKNHIPHDVKEIVDVLDMHHIPKYVTIVGGEPTDQLEGLKELIIMLHERGYEVILFSWHDPKWIKNKLGYKLLSKISYAVCGPYVESLRIYDTSKDNGINNVIGSSNQIIFRVEKDTIELTKVEFLDKIVYENNKPKFIRK
jgi:organic radical activating enzyme